MKRTLIALPLALAVSTTVVSASPPYGRQPYNNQWSLEVGVFDPRGDSDLWSTNEKTFTFETEDLDDFYLGAKVGSQINNFVAFDVGAFWYDGDTDSAYRDFTDLNGFPIKHETRLTLVPLTADLRIMPFGQFREGNHRDPMAVVPYIGFGAGAVYWDYEEEGEFIDFGSMTFFNARYSSQGIAPEYHGFVGVDVMLNRQVSIFIEGRATRSEDELDSDFDGFDDFDLSGTTLTAGTRIRF